MKKTMLMGIIALVILTIGAIGCKKDKNDSSDGNDDLKGTGSISVTIKSDAVLTTRAIGTPTPESEKTVKSFAVYVFNNTTGAIEKSETFTGSLSGEINGLSVAGTKKVVVLVNRPDGYPSISNYSEFNTSSHMISLDTQVPGDFSSSGLFMSGQTSAPVQLKTNETVSVTIPVKRLTAKIRLGSLKASPAEGLNLSDFRLTGVSVQKARSAAPVSGNLSVTGFEYASGIVPANSSDILKSYLHELYGLPENYISGTELSPNAYFYVFPNDNTNGQATRFTLYGSYKGNPMYYTFLINDKASGSGANAPDGTWIQRNKIYTLNVTLRKLANGGDDPNTPNEEASLNVNIEVADWDGELIQTVEW